MGWPKNLVLVRHAESKGNVLTLEERPQYDMATHAYPLTERGVRQAEITRDYIKSTFKEGFDVRYVSYYVRSRETMSILAPNEKVYEDPRLAEAQRGIYHFMTRDQIAARFPEELGRKDREGLYHYRPWGGENWPDVELRIHSFMTTLARDYAGMNVIMVVHGHWLLLFQRLVHHFSIEEAVKMYGAGVFDNASVTHYARGVTGRLKLESQNIVPWKGKIP